MEETSKKVRHTADQWKVSYYTVSNLRYTYKINDYTVQETDEEAEANAQLIAAAPSLLEALEEAKEHLKYFGDNVTVESIEKVIKLAKGNGES